MNDEINNELDYLRVGHLTYYVLKVIEGLPKVDMDPYYALIRQEIENKNRLGAGSSLLYSRLMLLSRRGFLKSKEGISSNPKAKKKVRCYFLTASGNQLLRNLEEERERISESLAVYG